MPAFDIDLVLPGALPEELARGVAAARDVFLTALIDPIQAAAAAQQARDVQERGSFAAVATEKEREAAAAFRLAEAAAIDAAFGPSRARPADAALVVTRRPH